MESNFQYEQGNKQCSEHLYWFWLFLIDIKIYPKSGLQDPEQYEMQNKTGSHESYWQDWAQGNTSVTESAEQKRKEKNKQARQVRRLPGRCQRGEEPGLQNYEKPLEVFKLARQQNAQFRGNF